jgi:hypothetical protein
MSKRLKFLLHDYGFALVAPLVALLIVAVLEPTGWVQRLENLTISLRFQLRSTSNRSTSFIGGRGRARSRPIFTSRLLPRVRTPARLRSICS